MMTIEYSTKNELLIRYRTDKKSKYKLKLSSQYLTNKLKSIIQDFHTKIVEKRTKEIQRYCVFALAIDNNSKK